MNAPNRDRLGAALAEAMDTALAQADIESALSQLTNVAVTQLGDARAIERPGALKPGERDYRVSGVFLITPDRTYNMLVANQGFPPEQRRLAIPIAWNHPGTVVETERPLLLENTDEHASFRQFLKSSRMGSSIYVPMFDASGAMFGQIVVAAQVRWTFRAEDLAGMQRIAKAGETLWLRLGGADWLAADYPAEDLWDASVQRVDAASAEPAINEERDG